MSWEPLDYYDQYLFIFFTILVNIEVFLSELSVFLNIRFFIFCIFIGCFLRCIYAYLLQIWSECLLIPIWSKYVSSHCLDIVSLSLLKASVALSYPYLEMTRLSGAPHTASLSLSVAAVCCVLSVNKGSGQFWLSRFTNRGPYKGRIILFWVGKLS